VRRLLLTPRRLRNLVLALVAALSLILSASCAPPPGGVRNAKNIARIQLKQRGWMPQGPCLEKLWQAESGWNVYARNPASGAYGIPQALPANRMRSAGRDWARNPATQIRWGLTYIKQRYGGPCNAWHHFQRRHWYVKATPEGDAPAGPSDSSTGAPASLPAQRSAAAPSTSADNASISN
jgi:Transglycosylase SLT domain